MQVTRIEQRSQFMILVTGARMAADRDQLVDAPIALLQLVKRHGSTP